MRCDFQSGLVFRTHNRSGYLFTCFRLPARYKEELTMTVKSMTKLRIDQKCNGDDLSKTLSHGLSPYYQSGIEVMIIQNFISFFLRTDT